MFGVQELVVILLIVVMLFGAKRIPEIMSGLGKGIKSFKQAVDGRDDDHTPMPHSPDDLDSSQPTERGTELKNLP